MVNHLDLSVLKCGMQFREKKKKLTFKNLGMVLIWMNLDLEFASFTEMELRLIHRYLV